MLNCHVKEFAIYTVLQAVLKQTIIAERQII